MASRRSRLQIKPNIGGPKGSGSKPAPKTVDPKPVTTETAVVPAGKLINSPRKSASVISSNPKEADQRKHIENKTDSGLKKEAQPTKLSDSKSILDSGPSVGRLTKLSPSLNTDNINNEKGKSTGSSLVTNNAKEYSEKDGREISAKKDSSPVVKEDRSSSSKDLIKEQHTDTTKPTNPPRRSRFPKITPNVTDAGKKRQRISTIPVETSENNSVRSFDEKGKERSETRQSANAKVLQEEMLIVNEDEILPASFTDIDGSSAQETGRTMSPQPFIPPKSPVKASSGNWSFTASPVKQPQVNISRARTVSTSEAPVIKKPRRTKIDIPTDRPPDKTTVRMKDLIRWNPSNNPMKPKIKPPEKILDGEKENAVVEKKPQLAINNNDKQSKDNTENDNEDDAVDDSVDSNKDNPEDDVDSAMPVPQVTIGPDGNIIINEKSLVVEDKSIEKAPSQDEDVIDETENTTTYSSFRSKPSFKRWTKKETMKFYKALAMIGADFFLIQKVLPSRTRMEIKRKFKREEKFNSSLVEKVLKEGIHFDKNFLEQGENSESSDEEVKKERKPKKEKVKPPKEKKPRKKYNKASVYKRNYLYFDPKSDTEEEKEGEEETVVENEKDDTTWQPPQSLNDLNVGKRESTSSSRRVVLSQEQKRQVDMTEEDSRKEIYRAVRLYPKYSPSSHPNISPSSTIDVQVQYKEGDDTQVTSSQPSQLPVLTGSNNVESVTSSSINDNSSMNTANRVSSATLPDCLNINNISTGNTAVQQSEGNPQYLAQHLTQMVPEFSNLPQINSGAHDLGTSAAPPVRVFQNVVMDNNADQYVLVTVVPERNDEETVIHIYKIPGPSVPSELGSSSVGPG